MNLQCQTCGAALQLEASARSTVCPYCESAQVVERPPDPNRPNPGFAIGFKVAREEAHRQVRTFLRRRRAFAPAGIHRAKLEDVRGVYAPAYLYGAVARSRYHADIGEYYWETVTVGSGKNRRTERVRRTEVRPLDGELATYVTDQIVTASRGVRNDELEHVEPYDLRLLARYQPAVVAGWIAEDASMPPDECARLAREEAQKEVGRRVARFMPGDTHSGLRESTRLEEESLDLVLVPLWIFAARYDLQAPPVRILVNGQTGKAWGKVPISWVKVSLTILALAAVIAGIVLGLDWSGKL